jgi:phage terminase small subunit
MEKIPVSLTAKQQRFIEEYPVDLNATQAAIRAGYSRKTAFVIGYENLKKPHIKAAIEKKLAVLSRNAGITAERILNELAIIAFSNIFDLIDDGGPSRLEIEMRRRFSELALFLLLNLRHNHR